jgi:hypothetical protein
MERKHIWVMEVEEGGRVIAKQEAICLIDRLPLKILALFTAIPMQFV